MTTTDFGITIVAAAVYAGTRAWSDRSERGRANIRMMYTSGWLPSFIRHWAAAPPKVAAFIPVFGALGVVPRPIAAWGLAGLMTFGLIAFVAAYQAPAAFLPRWLRDEIDQGITPATRPDGMDMLLLWLGVPILVVSTAGCAFFAWQITTGHM